MITIVKPGHELMTPAPAVAGLLRLVERAGRVCYKSEAKIGGGSAERFVKGIIKSGHESVIEHGNITVKIICDRSCSHQLVRHRIAAYCLSGDTEVIAFQKITGNPTKRWTLHQLADWQDDPKRKGRLKLIRLRSMDGLKRLVPGKIKTLIRSGVQTVYEVITRCGRSIKATSKHRFLTTSGWKRLSDLRLGDSLLANGVAALENAEWLEEMYLGRNMMRPELAKLIGVSDGTLGKVLRKFGLQKHHSQYPNRSPGHGVPGMHGVDGRHAISERMRGAGNHRWRGADAGQQAGRGRAANTYDTIECESCGTTAGTLHRHHVDKNTLNNAPSNVMILCQTCHRAHDVERGGRTVMTVIRTPIVSIKKIGQEETFDIEMEGPDHNFIADGLVVHNSQESQRYCDYGDEDGGLRVICPPKIAKVHDGWYWRNDAGIWKYRAQLDSKGTGMAPPVYELFGSDEDDRDTAERFYQWLISISRSYDAYQELRASDVPPEDARSVLPNATKTEVVTTFNLRQWRHVFKERGLNKHAQWQIREIMLGILREFAEILPAVFGDLTQ